MVSRSAHACPESVRGVLRRDGIDEEATAPLEAGDPCELRDHLQMPVEGLELRLAERRRVQHEVERRVAQDLVSAGQGLAGDRGRAAELLFPVYLGRGAVAGTGGTRAVPTEC